MVSAPRVSQDASATVARTRSPLFVIPAPVGAHGNAARYHHLRSRNAHGVVAPKRVRGNQNLGDVRFRLRTLRTHMPQKFVANFLLLGALLSAIFAAASAHAQSCTIDAQCSGGGRSVAMCSGDMLVVTSARCIGGSCQQREERRQNCGPAASQVLSCMGNIAVRSGGGCDTISQSCSVRTDRDVCVKSCACVKNRLIVSTGQCISGAGCARVIIQCQNGCTCSGEPRCL